VIFSWASRSRSENPEPFVVRASRPQEGVEENLQPLHPQFDSGYNSSMIRFIVATVIVLGTGCGGPVTDHPPESSPDPTQPAAAAATGKHLVYLHGKIIEDEGRRPTHPQFGIYEYQAILDEFTASGFIVLSDQRPAGAQPRDWAETTAAEVRELLDQGVLARDITIVGFSKGGVIAVLTALELADPDLNFVFIACCGPWIDRIFDTPDEQISGRMLSLYEASDHTGSCRALFDRASADSITDEIEMHIGDGHGAFYRPHPEWVEPVVRWARGEDPAPTGLSDLESGEHLVD